jgi:hypothetical protein
VQDNETLVDRLRSVGEDRVVSSADYSNEDDLEMAAWFDRAVLNGRTKRKIGVENARAFLKLGGQVRGTCLARFSQGATNEEFCPKFQSMQFSILPEPTVSYQFELFLCKLISCLDSLAIHDSMHIAIPTKLHMHLPTPPIVVPI